MKYLVWEVTLEIPASSVHLLEEACNEFKKVAIARPPIFFKDLKPIGKNQWRKEEFKGLVEIPESFSVYTIYLNFQPLIPNTNVNFGEKAIGKTSHKLPLELFPYDGEEEWK